MELINNLQADILEHLGRFGFLAVSQFQMLTEKSVGYLREMLGMLSRLGYIKSYRIEITYKVRAENIYFLTPQGKEFLLSHKNAFADDIKLPVSKTPAVTKDYIHRMSFISVHIHAYKYLQKHHIPLTGFYTYFDKTGSVKAGSLTAKTKIPLGKGASYIPDGVMTTEQHLYLIEMYCDKDSKRIINQLALHAKAIALGTPAATFCDEKINPFVLAVFSHAGIKQAVIKRLQQSEGFATMSKLFFFATLDDAKNNFGSAFTTINSESLVIK